MIWAIKNNLKVKATPEIKNALCPLCNQKVISKCGKIKIWHWAHKIKSNCDSFKENETRWHINWKNNFPKENQEFIKEVEGEKHIADIKTKEGLIIEFQNSPISVKNLISRENFWKNLIWILNGKTIGKNIIYFKRRYKWKWFPNSWKFSNNPIYVDKGDEFLYKLNYVGIAGEFNKISKDAFIIQNGGNPFKNEKESEN